MKKYFFCGAVVSIFFFGSTAFAMPAKCEKYTAELVSKKGEVTITTHASDWNGSSFLDIGTSVNGVIKKSCTKAFGENQKQVCGIKIKNVKYISDEDCWD